MSEAEEVRWCEDRRAEVSEYLAGEQVEHGRVGEWAAWHLPPYVAIWAIESKKSPGSVGWWAICGDLHTDYVSAATIKNPRDAVRAIVQRWLDHGQKMERGEADAGFIIGRPDDWPTIAPLLDSRAAMLLEWANDDAVWEESDCA